MLTCVLLRRVELWCAMSRRIASRRDSLRAHRVVMYCVVVNRVVVWCGVVWYGMMWYGIPTKCDMLTLSTHRLLN